MNNSNKQAKNINSLVELMMLKDGEKINSTVMVEKKLHFNETSGFGSFLCSFEVESDGSFIMSGVFLDMPVEYRTYHVVGERSTYNHKPQIRVQLCELTIPTGMGSNFFFVFSLERMSQYAAPLSDVLKEKTIEVIMNSTEAEINTHAGIKMLSHRIPNIYDVINTQRELIVSMFENSALLNRLTALELSKSASRKIFKLFGPKAYNVLEDNPYVLLEHYDDLGYGLDFCDKVAQRFGFKANDPNRLEYGVIYALITSEQAGNVYMPKDEFFEQLTQELTVKIPENKLHALAKANHGSFIFHYFNQDWQVDPEEINALIEKRNNFVYGANNESIVLYEPARTDMEKSIKSAVQKKLVVEVQGRIYGKRMFVKEGLLAFHIGQHIKNSLGAQNKGTSEARIKKAISSFTLEKMQEAACVEVLSHVGVVVISGSAGTGKTYLIKAIIEGYKNLYKRPDSSIILMAPTGRAAKRLEESTQFEAKTIHRGLGTTQEGEWVFNMSNPLPQSLIIVDEFSMVDTELAFHLFDAINVGSRVVLVGDTKQLASVGPGNVLKDMITSGSVKVVELDVIKRQRENSDIVDNAIRVINKEPLCISGKNKDAFVLYKSQNEQIISSTIASMHKIKANLGTDIEQTQVLIPLRKAKIGTYYINHLLQREFNNTTDSSIIAKQFEMYNSAERKTDLVTTYFRKGDKVINIKNNYQAKWFTKDQNGKYVADLSTMIITNGEIGIIEDIVKPVRGSGDKFANRIIVRVDDKYIFFDDDFDNLEHAYAITVHKSQGSQWRAVICLIAGSHKKMLTNNLVYTALTRPSEFLAVIGEEQAISFGIENDAIDKRYSTLREYLTKA